jgi:hypothetical protein
MLHHHTKIFSMDPLSSFPMPQDMYGLGLEHLFQVAGLHNKRLLHGHGQGPSPVIGAPSSTVGQNLFGGVDFLHQYGGGAAELFGYAVWV